MYKVSLFYRDGNNYKCHFDVEVENELIDELELDMENDIDNECRSDVMFEIEDFGLTMYDIPLIGEYGEDDMDHNYVSITAIKEVDNG